MMRVVSAEQMREIDRITIQDRGIAGRELMERAGAAIAREALERFEPGAVAVIAGKGNNGGDGFVAARHLREAGAFVRLYLLPSREELTGDAALAFDDLPLEIPIESADIESLAEQLAEFDVIIDALLGTGTRGPATGPANHATARAMKRVVEAINAARVPVVSADIPSGLPADPINPAEVAEYPHVRAAVTVTLGLPKLGLIMDPGLRSAGVISIAEIGFPKDLLESESITTSIPGLDDAARALPPRLAWGHKATFGRVMILAGSRGMTGAAVLTARAAQRSGAGLVYSVYPGALGNIMESHLIEPVKIPLGSDGFHFQDENTYAVLVEAQNMDAVALGPGIGRHPDTAQFAEGIIRRVAAPLVIDADGLNLLAGHLDWLKDRTGPTVLTPHPGEAERLLKIPKEALEYERLDLFTAFAKEYNAVVVLKGSQTITTTSDGRRIINPTGNTGLAKGGSGDVLTGLIAGLLAQGMKPEDAAWLGVFVHGVAADKAAAKHGVRAMIASDVIENLGAAFMDLKPAP